MVGSRLPHAVLDPAIEAAKAQTRQTARESGIQAAP